MKITHDLNGNTLIDGSNCIIFTSNENGMESHRMDQGTLCDGNNVLIEKSIRIIKVTESQLSEISESDPKKFTSFDFFGLLFIALVNFILFAVTWAICYNFYTKYAETAFIVGMIWLAVVLIIKFTR